MASVLNFLTRTEKWEGLYGTRGLQWKISDNEVLVNIKLSEAILRLQEPEPREPKSPFLQFSFNFMTGLSDLITHWYHKLDRSKYIVGILYASWFIGFLRSFTLLDHLTDIHIWGVILVLRLSPT